MSMRKIELEAMSVDDLWSLREGIGRILSARITSERRELDKRLLVLVRARDAIEERDTPQSYDGNGNARRQYPTVFPKYRNDQTPFETWSGRGKQPRWLTVAIKTGRKIEEFRIGEMPAAGTVKRERGSSTRFRDEVE
jgi:DNA-binding protein H-NS